VEKRDPKNYRVLVVDDEKETVDLLCNRLKTQGFENVDTAEDGLDAYNRCVTMLRGNKPYDLVVADLKMRKLNGLEFLEKIRKNDFLSDTPFLLISGTFDPENLARAMKLKVKHFLVKPFRPEDFDKKFEECLTSLKLA